MEVEIKAICENLEEMRKKLTDIGAKQLKKVRQIDNYFNSPVRDFRKTNEYLRIRENVNSSSKLAYHINMGSGTNKEFEIHVSDPKITMEILGKLGFEKLGVIEKDREYFELDGLKIVLDDVSGIGRFMEIETECETEEEAKKGRILCMDVLEKLGVGKDKLTELWLADIATGKVKR